MPDYAGPLLQRVVLSRTLWLVVAWPIVGFVWQVLVVRRRLARARGPDATKRALGSARNAGVGCLALAAAATLAHALVLAGAPHAEQALFEPGARGVVVGQLDAELDLSFDPLSATFCGLACFVALGVAAFLAVGRSQAVDWRPWAWLQLSLAGALVAFVSDGFVGTALGWAMSGAAAAWLAGWNNSALGIVVALRSAVAIAAMCVGAALLFWGLGGSWDGDDYAPDPPPRFAAVRVGGWAEASEGRDSEGSSATSPGVGALTFTSVPGAVVFLDDARSALGQSPFAGLPVRAGTHALRIHSGDGTNDDILGRVTVEDGAEVALVPVGPTLAFRAIADQLGLHDRTDDTPVRNQLEARVGPGAGSVVAASLLAFLAAGGLMSGASPSSGSPPVLATLAHGATQAALGFYLVARLAFLFPLAQSTWIAVEAAGAAILFVASWRAPTSSGIRRWVAFASAAPPALALLALGAAGVTVATGVFVACGATVAILRLATARRLEPVPEQPGVVVVPPSIEEQLLVIAPERLGVLLVRMDRWVVSSIAGTIAALTRAVAWVMVTLDEQVVAAPADFVAGKIMRLERGVEPVVGVPIGRAAWALLGTLAFAAVAHALWTGR